MTKTEAQKHAEKLITSKSKFDLMDLHEYAIHCKDYGIEKDNEALFELVKDDALTSLIWSTSCLRKRDSRVENIILNSTLAKDSLILGYLESFPDVKDGPLYDEIEKSPALAVRFAQLVLEDRLPQSLETLVFKDKEARELYTELLKFLQSEKEAKSQEGEGGE